MDLYALVNSQTIGKYLRDIGYQFNSLEAAWLIYACEGLGYEEKRVLWLELMENMPDCPIPQRMNCEGWESLHAFLKLYMETVEREYDEFLEDGSAGKYVYRYSFRMSNDSDWEEYNNVYPSLGKCLEACQQEVVNWQSTWEDCGTEVLRYSIKRQSLENELDIMQVDYFPDGRFIAIPVNSQRSDEEKAIFDSSLEGLWFDFPTPFQRGDILWLAPASGRARHDCGIPFVLMDLATWETPECVLNAGDNIDMFAWGYFVYDDGRICAEHICNYMDVDYYPNQEKLSTNPLGQMLLDLSQFIKGGMDVADLLNAYRKNILTGLAQAEPCGRLPSMALKQLLRE